jgi:type IV pilus biogenesis protein PilP
MIKPFVHMGTPLNSTLLSGRCDKNTARPRHKHLSFIAISFISGIALSNVALAQSGATFGALPGNEQALEALTPGELAADVASGLNGSLLTSSSAVSSTEPSSQAVAADTSEPFDLDAALADLLKFPDCPVDKIREAYEHVVTDQDVFNTLAITEQVLLLCRERQDLINAYTESATEFMDGLREAALSSEALVAAQNQEQSLKAEIDKLLTTKTQIEAQIAAARRMQAALKDPATTVPKAETSDTETTTPTEVAPSEGDLTPHRFSLVATTGFGDEARAMLLDAETGESLHVKAGDILPGGVTITSINGLSVVAKNASGSFKVAISEEERVADVDRSIGGIAWREVGAKPKTVAAAGINSALDPAAPSGTQPASAQSVTVFEGYSQ